MRKVALDIEATTGGHLDVVVASHDHWDNVSGFAQAREVFDRITIGEVWMTWTEDPSDTEAEAMRRNRGLALRGLRVMASRHTPVHAEAKNSAAARLRVPLSFFGLTTGANPRAVLEYLKDHPSRPVVRYRQPRWSSRGPSRHRWVARLYPRSHSRASAR